MSFEGKLKEQYIAVKYGDLASIESAAMVLLTTGGLGSEANSDLVVAVGAIMKELLNFKEDFKTKNKDHEN